MPHRPLTSLGCVPGAVTLGCDQKDEKSQWGNCRGRGWEMGPCVMSVRSPRGPRDLSPEKWKAKELRPERSRALTVRALESHGRDLSRREMWSLWLPCGGRFKRGGVETDIRGREGAGLWG